MLSQESRGGQEREKRNSPPAKHARKECHLFFLKIHYTRRRFDARTQTYFYENMYATLSL